MRLSSVCGLHGDVAKQLLSYWGQPTETNFSIIRHIIYKKKFAYQDALLVKKTQKTIFHHLTRKVLFYIYKF
jgi:hypothetical protein